MKKTKIAVFFVVFCVCNCAFGEKKGDCGGHVHWLLSDGKLTISGEGNMANYNANNLEPWHKDASTVLSVEIENGVTSIGDYAFYQCSHLVNITIPDTVTSIGVRAFFDCRDLKNLTIPDNVTSIGLDAFLDCSNLTRAIIPKNVESIGRSPFRGCSKLCAVELSENNSYFVTIDGVLFNKDCTLLIQYPPGLKNTTYIIPDGVTSIGEYAFYSIHTLKRVVFPDGVSSIKGFAFASCYGLTNVTIPESVKTIGSYAFYYCSSLTELMIFDSVKSFGEYAFYYCQNLVSVFYQGLDDFKASNVLGSCAALRDVCVPPKYVSNTFCGEKVTSSSENCQSFRRMFNQCYKGVYIEGMFLQEKRENIPNESLCNEMECDRNDVRNEWSVDWDGRTNECMSYVCEDETGFVLFARCGTGEMCADGTCVKDTNLATVNTSVEIAMNNGVDAEEMDEEEILEYFFTFGIDPDQIGFDVDEAGNVIRVIIHTENPESAADIATGVQNCINSV